MPLNLRDRFGTVRQCGGMEVDWAVRLRHEILTARPRVQQVRGPTPLQLLDFEEGLRVHCKREDLGPIHAYKWRGAFNRLAQLSRAELGTGVVTASAGNHAQGVALAATRCGTTAHIYMPETTPATKQEAVRKWGGDHVEIHLVGDTFGTATEGARTAQKATGRIYVSAYDDWGVMGGQGTIADEIVLSGEGPFDFAYLQIGGGGMAGAVAFWLKEHFPDIRIVGVEGTEQASYRAAKMAGHPVALGKMDLFCDGTAIPQVGDRCFPALEASIDELTTVDNDEVCAAILSLWRAGRCIAEPSGAMGIAAILRDRARLAGHRVLAIICGANLDFSKLALIANRAPFGLPDRHYLRITIGEARGQLHKLLSEHFQGVNIVDFQYGQAHEDVAHHVIGFEANPTRLKDLAATLDRDRIPHETVTGGTDVRFRVIHYRPERFAHPLFVRMEFNERTGAIRQILEEISPHARLSYFNYTHTGERIGRALVCLDFVSPEERDAFPARRLTTGGILHDFEPLSPETARRLLL